MVSRIDKEKERIHELIPYVPDLDENYKNEQIKVIDNMTKRQESIKTRTEENKKIEVLAYRDIIEVLQRYREKFDFSSTLLNQNSPSLRIKEYSIY